MQSSYHRHIILYSIVLHEFIADAAAAVFFSRYADAMLRAAAAAFAASAFSCCLSPLPYAICYAMPC